MVLPYFEDHLLGDRPQIRLALLDSERLANRTRRVRTPSDNHGRRAGIARHADTSLDAARYQHLA